MLYPVILEGSYCLGNLFLYFCSLFLQSILHRVFKIILLQLQAKIERSDSCIYSITPPPIRPILSFLYSSKCSKCNSASVMFTDTQVSVIPIIFKLLAQDVELGVPFPVGKTCQDSNRPH